MEIPAGIVLFGDSKMRIFSRGDGDEGESTPERGLGMWTIFYPRQQRPRPRKPY
jgi:hypothetical protein